MSERSSGVDRVRHGGGETMEGVKQTGNLNKGEKKDEMGIMRHQVSAMYTSD